MRILITVVESPGLALAAKLRQQGRSPVQVEKATTYGDAGYAIGFTAGASTTRRLRRRSRAA